MKSIILTTLLIFSLAILSSISFAQDNLWEKTYVDALQKGVTTANNVIKTNNNKGGGLGYTPSQETILEGAIKNAIALKAPACQMMKIAIDMNYNPYSVIKDIFSLGGEIDLNQLCMCATESGINKQIVARAAQEAVSPLGTPIYKRDEIAQAQCLREVGLGFSPSAVKSPPKVTPPEPPIPFSQSGPST